MKVITEESLIIARNALLKKGNNLGACAIDMLISDHLKEIDILTVSKLRPMGEHPEIPANKMCCYLLLYSVNMSVPRICRFDLHNGFDADARKSGIGWLYLPTYKPESTGDGE